MSIPVIPVNPHTDSVIHSIFFLPLAVFWYGRPNGRLLLNLEVTLSTPAVLSRITPFLWFDSNAEEAVDFYLSVFKNSRRIAELRAVDEIQGPVGSILTITFELDGQQLVALNGGPNFKFTEAISLVVNCGSQDEIDEYWTKLTDGGAEIQCGWLKDRFGLCWQVVPANIAELLKNPRAFQAMLGMKKLVIAQLEDAAGS
jgi:predicted 3-demethylubiquinone-9 3-methyltransferase (glyoxalase superfamily)